VSSTRRDLSRILVESAGPRPLTILCFCMTAARVELPFGGIASTGSSILKAVIQGRTGTGRTRPPAIERILIHLSMTVDNFLVCTCG